MWNYLAGLACIMALLVVIILLVRICHESYLTYVISFLINENRKWYDQLLRLFCAYYVLGGILAVALALIKTDFDVPAATNCFPLYFLSSCFFLFIARIYTTTKLISTEPNVRRITRHMNHINFLAFFGIVTGGLELLISVTQNPKTMESWIYTFLDTTFIIEVGIADTLVLFIHWTIILMGIPSIFSALELLLIRIRKHTIT